MYIYYVQQYAPHNRLHYGRVEGGCQHPYDKKGLLNNLKTHKKNSDYVSCLIPSWAKVPNG